MAEQFLQAAQVGAAGQQMRRKAVAQRVRRRAFGEAQARARALHRAADDRRRQWPSPLSAEQRRVGGEVVGAQSDIGMDALAYRGQQRHDPRLAALAGNAQRLAER